MLCSMTGFSSKNIVLSDATQCLITLKSLNSRFFECNCKLPSVFSHLETVLQKKLRQKLIRGTIFLTVHRENSQEIGTSIQPNRAAIAGYIAAVETIKTEYKLMGDITARELIMLPHALVYDEKPIFDGVGEQLLETIDLLIDDLNKERQAEGRVLDADICERLVIIKEAVEVIDQRSREVREQKKIVLLENFKLLLVSLEQDVIAENCSSLFNQLEKIDIHEEIVRFKSHLITLDSVLVSPLIEKSKKCDFIFQELFREINTMMAKCSDALIGRLGITIKAELEKAREQIQNCI